MVHLWLRAETKKNEKRTALTPDVCTKLLAKGFLISVERSDQRSIGYKEYEAVGCKLVDFGSWKTAPLDCIVIGLKELPENDDSPLVHTHIMFAHCYKNQAGWKEVLGRFISGKGILLDLEFLAVNGRRVAAFGYYAGFAGAAVAIDVWCHKQLDPNTAVPKMNPFASQQALIAYSKDRLQKAIAVYGKSPSVMVMGALGRCGTGACDFAQAVGIPSIVRWDMAETKKGGPFEEILMNEIFVNCIYLSQPIPPFLTAQMLAHDNRPLSVLCDVSCDATNPHNPVPVYYGATTFDDPVIEVPVEGHEPLTVIAIDHLPTLLPREASVTFCNDLLPSLYALPDRQSSSVWSDAEKLFHQKSTEAIN